MNEGKMNEEDERRRKMKNMNEEDKWGRRMKKMNEGKINEEEKWRKDEWRR